MTEPTWRSLDFERLRFDSRGLVPVVVQDIVTGAVLMLGWADREALQRTVERGEGWFWSRSRSELWHKGATSGNTLEVDTVAMDCDADAVLYRVRPNGPTCHLGERTCFGPAAGEIELGWLVEVLRERRAAADPDASYTARLFAAGTPRIAQKVAEEGAEVALAAVASAGGLEGAGDVVDEAADLLYHLLVLLLDAEIPPRRVAERLVARHATSPSVGSSSAASGEERA
ncbi:MAG: bifunctional phosphoribosyl-AMP cyclohydrolase/phosphoribosyl-ATP diphosphatase HisIE [Acidobacteriota bacterium]